MRRATLEATLRALGWQSTGRTSGERHILWRHPEDPRLLAVPTEELVFDAVAERLIAQATERRRR